MEAMSRELPDVTLLIEELAITSDKKQNDTLMVGNEAIINLNLTNGIARFPHLHGGVEKSCVSIAFLEPTDSRLLSGL